MKRVWLWFRFWFFFCFVVVLIYNLKSTLEVDSITEGCDQACFTEGLRKSLLQWDHD